MDPERSLVPFQSCWKPKIFRPSHKSILKREDDSGLLTPVIQSHTLLSERSANTKGAIIQSAEFRPFTWFLLSVLDYYRDA
ncbi:hypothetical protein CEXT_377431 [Caerostris extrusa]|uniref:Ycf15 n=1 Tax=Caerostris extrusa TaxID=172846 RepID=A0AAV4QFP9_CAEEX|nr:hypothetical protein CEXT_377431 [Caerostris extrusa]